MNCASADAYIIRKSSTMLRFGGMKVLSFTQRQSHSRD